MGESKRREAEELVEAADERAEVVDEAVALLADTWRAASSLNDAPGAWRAQLREAPRPTPEAVASLAAALLLRRAVEELACVVEELPEKNAAMLSAVVKANSRPAAPAGKFTLVDPPEPPRRG
jgi:hypothetical protein